MKITILLVLRGHILSVNLRSEQLRWFLKLKEKRTFDFKEKYMKGDLEMWGNGICTKKNSIRRKKKSSK